MYNLSSEITLRASGWTLSLHVLINKPDNRPAAWTFSVSGQRSLIRISSAALERWRFTRVFCQEHCIKHKDLKHRVLDWADWRFLGLRSFLTCFWFLHRTWRSSEFHWLNVNICQSKHRQLSVINIHISVFKWGQKSLQRAAACLTPSFDPSAEICSFCFCRTGWTFGNQRCLNTTTSSWTVRLRLCDFTSVWAFKHRNSVFFFLPLSDWNYCISIVSVLNTYRNL